MAKKIDALEEFFPKLAQLARGPRRSAHPTPSPRHQALKDRLAILGIDAGIERVGNHWDVWYKGSTSECANLKEATYSVEDFEDEAIRAAFVALNPGTNELKVYDNVNQNGYSHGPYTHEELINKYLA